MVTSLVEYGHHFSAQCATIHSYGSNTIYLNCVMSRRRSSTYLPPLEPFPDEEETFTPFDQHRALPTLQDSLKLKKKVRLSRLEFNL